MAPRGRPRRGRPREVELSKRRIGAPSACDRRMGRYFGIAAVGLVVAGHFGRMVSLKDGQITSVPLQSAIGRPNLVGVETQYDVERYNGRRSILNTPTGVKQWAQALPEKGYPATAR